MTNEFKKDIEAMCQKYGGLAGVLERLTDLERDAAHKMREIKSKEAAKRASCYDKMADKLLDARDYWTSF